MPASLQARRQPVGSPTCKNSSSFLSSFFSCLAGTSPRTVSGHPGTGTHSQTRLAGKCFARSGCRNWPLGRVYLTREALRGHEKSVRAGMVSLRQAPGATLPLNWTWLILRTVIGLSVLGLLFLSQRFWYRAIWRVTSNWGSQGLRVAVRLIYVALLLLIIATSADGFR